MERYSVTNRPKQLQIGDEIIICEVLHVVTYTKGYYLDASSKFNEYAFQKMGLNPRDVAKNVYGYDKGGSWPFADSLQDLLKLVNFMLDTSVTGHI